MERRAQIFLKQIQAASGPVMVTRNGMDRKCASIDRLPNQFVLVLFTVIGVVAGQQSKIDARSEVTIGFRRSASESRCNSAHPSLQMCRSPNCNQETVLFMLFGPRLKLRNQRDPANHQKRANDSPWIDRVYRHVKPAEMVEQQ